MIVTTIGLSAADLRISQGISPWGGSVIIVLLVYLLFILRDARKNADAVFGLVEAPYSIITDKSVEEADLLCDNHARALTDQGFPLSRVCERFLISRTDWRYYNPDRLVEEGWRELVQEIRDHFIRLSRRVTAQARFHLFFVTSPTVVLAFGATLGRDIRARAYQYFGPDGFVPVFDPEAAGSSESYHRLQELVTEYHEIKVEPSGDSDSKDVAVVLQFVGHPLSAVDSVFDGKVSVLSVSHVRYYGNLPPTHNWMNVARELASLVLREVSNGKVVHLFFGLPTGLSFALGHLLGDHNPIRVYHYDKELDKYRFVFALNQAMQRVPPAQSRAAVV
jgi:hypothetical protein